MPRADVIIPVQVPSIPPNPGVTYPIIRADRHRDIHHANITLSYHLMPYVGLLTSGVAATAEGMVEIPELQKK